LLVSQCVFDLAVVVLGRIVARLPSVLHKTNAALVGGFVAESLSGRDIFSKFFWVVVPFALTGS